MSQIYPSLTVVLLFVLPLAGLSIRAQEKQDKKKEESMLECRIIVKKGERASFPSEIASLAFEIKNVSDKTIDIPYTRDPILQYLKGEVRTPDGKIAKYDYGMGLSPISSTPKIFTLKPGQTFRVSHGIDLLGAEGPGLYKIQVVFEYEKIKAASTVVEVKLKAVKKK